jgi:hypothetical protein
MPDNIVVDRIEHRIGMAAPRFGPARTDRPKYTQQAGQRGRNPAVPAIGFPEM